jgi:hypothetical protein
MNTDMTQSQTADDTSSDLSSVPNDYTYESNQDNTGQKSSNNDGTVDTAGDDISGVNEFIEEAKALIELINKITENEELTKNLDSLSSGTADGSSSETAPASETSYPSQSDTELASEPSYESQGETEPASETSYESLSETEPASEPSYESKSETEPASETSYESQSGTEPASETSYESLSETEPASETSSESQNETAPATETSEESQVDATETASGLEDLPSLSMEPSVQELKSWVSETYDLFPEFAEIYEGELGLTKDEAMAFHYAVMSRESGKDGYWQMDLETGEGGAGHAWGPFQAAVTNFTGGGYDSDILQDTGLVTPSIDSFKDPEVSTYAGMKRLAEGVVEAMEGLGTGQSADTYLLGSIAHHNTGHVESATDSGWLEGYGDEVLRLMDGYLDGHMSDSKAYWTGEPI